MIIALGLLAAAPLEVTSAHEQVDVNGQRFWWIRPGVPLSVSVEHAPDEKLEVDFIRIGGGAPPPEATDVKVERDDEPRKITIRVPIEDDRRVSGQDDLRASYPVRYRFDVARPMSVFKFSVSKEAAPQGIGVTLNRRRPPSDVLSLAPLPAPKPVGKPPKPVKAPPVLAEPDPLPDATDEPEPVDDPPQAPAVDDPAPAPEQPRPNPTPAIEIAAPPPKAEPLERTEVRPPPNADLPPATTYEDGGMNLGIVPINLNLQLSPGIGIQPTGGLSSWPASFGFRTMAFYRHGDSIWNRFGIGLSGNISYETAQGDAAVPTVRLSWSALATRMRLELGAEVFRIPVGANYVFFSVIGGAGVLMGSHVFLANGVPSNSFMFGPTVRLGAEAGIKLGPGAITASVPVDWSWDFTSKVTGYAPLASALYVGYRIDL